MSRWLPLLAVLALACPARAEPAPASLDSLVETLRGMGLVLRRAREKLDADVSLDGHDVLERLNQAQRWSLAEDHPKAALRLLQLLARPGFERSRAYPDALAALADAEWALGLTRAARAHLREALAVQGQAPTHWRDRLARYLELQGSRPALPELRALWAEYQRVGPASPPDQVDQVLRYRFARALHFAEARAEARALFEAVPEDDPHRLRALYFLGVLDVADGEWMRAAVSFEAALAAFRASDPLPPTPADRLEDAEDAPRLVALEASELGEGPADALLELDERVDSRRRVGALIHLALARLAAAREDWPTAWRHYRQVPRGGPEFTAALSEGSFVLARQEEFEWCARLVDQLLAGRGVDVSAAQLTLWKLQLLARSERYEAAQEGYTRFAEDLERRQAGLGAAAAADRLFPAEILAWTAPAQTRRIRQLEAEIVTLREALAEAAELRAELEALRRDRDLLPVVRFGRETYARLQGETAAFAQRLAQAAAAGPAAPGGPVPPSPADLARLQASLARLRARLEAFGGRLSAYEAAYRARLDEVLDAEGPALEAQARLLAADEASARALATDLRADAAANLARYAAEARFGLVDIAYWRKEAISRQIRRLHAQRRAASEPLEAAERDLEAEGP